MDEIVYTPQKAAYLRWMEQEGIPIFDGLAVEDVTELPRKPWARMGGTGSYIQLKGSGGVTGMYVVEIPPGGALEPERHMYDELLYVLKGRGSTEVWYDGMRKQAFEWSEGSLFAPPLNTWHRLYNGARESAFLLAVTTAPIIMDFFRDSDFVFNNSYAFKSRYQGEDSYFNMSTKRYKAKRTSMWDTNFIADARTAPLDAAPYKVAEGGITCFEMADNSLIGHMSEWPSGIYHKAHYHAAGAILLVAEEPVEDRRKIRFDVLESEELFEQQRIAVVAIKLNPVPFLGQPPAFDHETHGIRHPLGRMGSVRRKEEDLAGANRDVHDLPALDRLQDHLAFELIEELGSVVDVIVLAVVRPADDHDDEIVSLEDLLVAHRRLEVAPVLVDPPLQIQRLRNHGVPRR